MPDANLEKIAWYCQNSGGKSHPVAGLQPNGWGLFDMSGNAAEWVNDRSAKQLEHIWDGRSVGLGFRLARTGKLDAR